MKYAYTKVCINPTMPVKGIGYALQTEPMKGLRDDLFGRILLLQDEKEIHVICALDLCYTRAADNDAFQADLEATWGGRINLIISCTHTHFGPDIGHPEYSKLLYSRLKEAILAMEPAEGDLTCSLTGEPFQGVGKSRISHWETDRIFAHTLCIYDKGQRVITLCTYNCHPTVLDGYTTFFTCEYPGIAMRTLEERHPGEAFLFLQGAAGDVSTRFTRREQTVEQLEEFAAVMADEFDALMARAGEPAEMNIVYSTRQLPFTHSLKDPATLVIPEYYSERERFVLQYGIDISKQNLEHPERLQHETRIDSMAFGPYRLVFAQNELFSEYNTPLDPAKAVLICYSHGYGRYIAGPSFDGMTYESLQDTLSDESRQALLDAIGEAGRTE